MINNVAGEINLTPEEIKKIFHHHFKVEADGIILVEKEKDSGDYFMNYWNANRTVAEMCENGVRCTAHFVQKILGFFKKLLNFIFI